MSVQSRWRHKASHSPPDGSSIHVDSETEADNDYIEMTECRDLETEQQQEEVEDKCIENVAESG